MIAIVSPMGTDTLPKATPDDERRRSDHQPDDGKRQTGVLAGTLQPAAAN